MDGLFCGGGFSRKYECFFAFAVVVVGVLTSTPTAGFPRVVSRICVEIGAFPAIVNNKFKKQFLFSAISMQLKLFEEYLDDRLFRSKCHV